MVAGGRLRPVVERTFSLEDAAAAVRQVETEHARGKVVVTVPARHQAADDDRDPHGGEHP
jgi:hypothetical protein